MKIENEFIPYEQALALKELGFDEPCLAYYNKKELFSFTQICNEPLEGHYIKVSNRLCTPLYQQAFRWFREKQAIEGFIHKAIEGTYYFVIKRLGNNESNIYEFITNAPKNVDTYEEAELECIKKLIEIVESKNK